MPKPSPTAQVGPNLWHFSAIVWGTSILLLSLFAMPISANPPGMRLQLCFCLAHFAGVFCLWRLAAKRGNPKRLMEIAIITLVFIYIVPLCMLVAPAIVLAAYALPTPAWQTVAAIMLACAVALAPVRIWSIGTDKNTGRRFDQFLASEVNESAMKARSIKALLDYVGCHAIEPSRIDGWSLTAALAAGAPIFASNIIYDSSSSSLAICAIVTTPMAMHAFSRMVVHAYLWIYRLRRFERETGIRIVVNLYGRS